MSQSNVSRTQPVPKTTISDWIGDEDDDYYDYYAGEKRQRGGRKKRKKNKDDTFGPAPPNWDAIYDFTRPTVYEEYKGSEEEFQEMLEWKRKLRVHRSKDYMSSEEEEDDRERYKGNFSRKTKARQDNH
jgi:splicing factor 45